MSEILKIINTYKNQLKNEDGLLGEIYFHEKGRLNINDGIFHFFKKRINEISLEEKDLDLRLTREKLLLGFYDNESVWKKFVVFTEKGLYAFSTCNNDDDYGEYDNILNVIYWDDLEAVKLEYNDDGKHAIRFQIKEGNGNDEFYHSVKRYGLAGEYFGANKYLACKLIFQLLNDINNKNTELNSVRQEVFQKKIDFIDKAIHAGKYKDVLSKLILENKDDYRARYFYHNYRIQAFYGLGENLNIINEVHDFRKFYDRNNFIHDSTLFYLYGMAYQYNEDSLNSIRWFNRALDEESKNETKDLDEIEELQSHIENSYEILKKEFAEIPIQKRKFIFMSDKILSSEMEGLVVLKTNDPPEKLKFPLSHPQLNEVYTFHPNNSSSYIPLKVYQKELFVDKLREFLLLLDVLGATKIDVINKNRNIEKNANSSEKTFGGKADYKFVGANVDYKKEKTDEDQLERELNLAFHQKLSPKKAPYIPEGLIWFHTDINWQRMAEQRMNGSLMSHRELITSKQIESLSSHELTKVNVELNALFAKANVDYQKDDFSKSSSENHYALEIQVEFEDIDNLKQVHINTPNTLLDSNQTSKINLDKYKDDVLFMLEDDGVIDEVERKLLNRKIEKYGISINEAEQIEKELMFNNDELKYLEEYKLLLEEGVIGEIEESMLERYAKRYDINKERKNIIERSIIKN